jgi:hypothetical protein
MPTYLQFTAAPTEGALAKGISDLLSPTHIRQDMARARAYVSANFDESVIARDLGCAYENVLKRRNGKDTRMEH